MLDDKNIITAMNQLFARISPLIKTNRRVLSDEEHEYLDIGNIDYTDMEAKQDEHESENDVDNLALSQLIRFPHFPPVLQRGDRRHDGD